LMAFCYWRVAITINRDYDRHEFAQFSRNFAIFFKNLGTKTNNGRKLAKYGALNGKKII